MPVWQIILLVSALIFACISIFLWIWNVLRAKKMREESFIAPSKKQPKQVKLPFKLDKFIDILGGIDNIASAASTNNKIKITLINRDKVDFSELKKIKNRGILDQSDSISIVLGTYVSSLSTMINDLKQIHNETQTHVE